MNNSAFEPNNHGACQSSATYLQGHEPYGGHSSSMGAVPMNSSTVSSQNDALQSINPSPAFQTHESLGTESFGNNQALQPFPGEPANSMGPPTKTRKRKAPTLRADVWEPLKDQIIDLHVTQGLSLQEVKKRMERSGFFAEVRQYRTRISQWGFDKNVKPKEMEAIVRKRQRRKLTQSKPDLEFRVRGSTVEPQKIERWMKRNNVPESFLYASSPAATTPSAVSCHTVSEYGSPNAMSTSAAGTPLQGLTPIDQSFNLSSPALSNSFLILPEGSVFIGQSPAPIYRSLPNLYPGMLPAPENSQSHLIPVYPSLDNNTVQPVLGPASNGPSQLRYREAEERRLRRELSEMEIMHGSDHSTTLSVLAGLVDVLLHQGRYVSAEMVARRLVKGCQAIYDNTDSRTAEALVCLGEVLCFQGLYSQADKLLRQASKFNESIRGKEHPETLASFNALSRNLIYQNRYEETEELLAQVVAIAERTLGEEHEFTLQIKEYMVLIMLSQGRSKEAEGLLLQVNELRKSMLGVEHPRTLYSMSRLAVAFRVQGRWNEAEDLAVRVLEIRKRILGEEHPDTLSSMHDLAHTWKYQGRMAQAVLLMRQSFRLQEQVLGPHHPVTESSLRCLNELEEEKSKAGS